MAEDWRAILAKAMRPLGADNADQNDAVRRL